MSIKKLMDSMPNTCEVIGTATLSWTMEGVGFGQVRFYVGEDGKTHCDNECMSNERIKKILNTLVDTCVMDDK